MRRTLGVGLAVAGGLVPCLAQDKPTGEPLELSTVETEQAVPVAYLDADGKTAHCAAVKLHWNPNASVGAEDEATSFTIDLPPENPGAAVFTAQLWSASLASALAWQQPWEGARWGVLQTPVTDGTGLDAALAVGMIATSARRPYPDKTVVIGTLNPDGSLGPVSHLLERLDAAAAAGMTRVIIPGLQRFDADASGQVTNIVRHATDLHLECVPVDNLVEATEKVMNDPLPDGTPSPSPPKYGNDVTSFIDDYAHREETAVEDNMKFAPKEADLPKYPPRLGTIWKSIYADDAAGQQAYRAGEVYAAYRLFARANAGMAGVNALIGQSRASFDVKAALAESDDLRNHLHTLTNPPVIDRGDLESSVLVAEMADWAYDINASLEGAQLVTKQTFSQRSDSTDGEKDRARETILFAIEQSKYLLDQSDFYSRLLFHISSGSPVHVDENAANLLPQLIPAQLATARIFTDGIRERANDLRDGLLFDPRLVAYVGVLREAQANWDARERKKEMQAEGATTAPAAATTTPGTTAVKPDATMAGAGVFDPGDTYKPPHTAAGPTVTAKKLSDAAQCLVWVNQDCEIATLDEKYLRLSGVVDPATHEWHVKDRAKLDALLQSAEAGARQGVAFAGKAEIDPTVLAMIYERAANLRIQDDDASALAALRNYWRCALLGNMCWQLAHTRKAQPVDLSKDVPVVPDKADKTDKTDKTTKSEKAVATDAAKTAAATPSGPIFPVPVTPPAPAAGTETSSTRAAADAATAKLLGETNPGPVHADTGGTADHSSVPVAPSVHTETPAPSVINDDNPPVVPVVHDAAHSPPRALPVQVETPQAVPAPPVATADPDASIPVAKVARYQDYSSPNAAPATNAIPPIIGPVPPPNKTDNADGHGSF